MSISTLITNQLRAYREGELTRERCKDEIESILYNDAAWYGSDAKQGAELFIRVWENFREEAEA